ncbi:MAG: glycoside hydrolase family 127 protein [Acidobacteria bacterium]|nr:glycoside hydrolase family 127 protein [Acidobacteriota bacterium]
MPHTSRSRYLSIIVAAAALIAVAGAVPQRAERITNAVADLARPLPLTAVRLTGGPLEHAQDLDAKYLLELDPDRMLAYYRQRAGLNPKAQPYGSRDGDGRNLTGHIAGHHYRHTRNGAALDIEIKFATWAEGILSGLSDAQLQQMLSTEFGGMNEVLADLYADTGDRRWLALSHKFDHRAVIEPLARGEDRLAGLHGNTQVPKILGLAARYGYTGDRADGAAASFFWDRVVGHHTFATGGHGKDEYFREPDMLSHIVDGRTSESCNVYNMLKLTRRLFALQPDVKYAEFQERALFNHILGSIDATGSMCYMVPVGRGVQREYQDMSRSFTCCVGSGMESHALHGDGIYYESGDRLWVNLYAPSAATWEAAGLQLQMDTTFPEGDSAALKLTARASKAFTLALRRPSWAAAGFVVDVNGTALKELPKPGSYVELTRTWKTGDVVHVTLPKALRLDLMPDNRRRAAIMWGPLVLAGDLGPEPQRGSGPRPPQQGSPALVAGLRPVSDWLKPVTGNPGTFRSDGVGHDRDVEFVPFYRLHRRTYSAYWDVFTPAEHEARVAEVAAERERQRKLAQATVAFVAPVDQQAERDANQQGEETSLVRPDGRPGRRAGKWFSYDVAVDPAQPLALVVTYHSDTRRARSFEILVDGQRVGEQTLPESSESRFFDVEYRIPAEIARGKQKVTVRFQAMTGSETAPVFGVRIVRSPTGPR